MWLSEEDPLAFIEELAADYDVRMHVAYFQVAFDGSGNPDKHKAIAIGGALATTKQWAAFGESWRTVLNREKLAYFKMAEAMTWFGEFTRKYNEWGKDREAKRAELLNELVSVALNYGFNPAGMGADVRMLTQDKIAKKKEELFKGAILRLLGQVKTWKSDDKVNHVTLLCDEEGDLELPIRSYIASLRRKHGATIAPIVGLCFCDDRVFLPIQLADMIAWLFRQHLERVIEAGDKDLPLTPLFERIRQNTRLGMDEAEAGRLVKTLEHHGKPPRSRR